MTHGHLLSFSLLSVKESIAKIGLTQISTLFTEILLLSIKMYTVYRKKTNK